MLTAAAANAHDDPKPRASHSAHMRNDRLKPTQFAFLTLAGDFSVFIRFPLNVRKIPFRRMGTFRVVGVSLFGTTRSTLQQIRGDCYADHLLLCSRNHHCRCDKMAPSVLWLTPSFTLSKSFHLSCS